VSLGPAILVYATRYALGRSSGAASDVEAGIVAILPAFHHDHGSREALIHEIAEARDRGELGDECDRECWLRALERLEACRP
jgi:hypothetical protein